MTGPGKPGIAVPRERSEKRVDYDGEIASQCVHTKE